jgi:hypothetical protein
VSDGAEPDIVRESELAAIGGYASNGAENDRRFVDSLSESLSSGIGIAVARRSDSSSLFVSANKVDRRGMTGATVLSMLLAIPLRGVTGLTVESKGGEAGRAVCMALRNVEPWGEVDKGEDVRRRDIDGCSTGGEIVRLEDSRGPDFEFDSALVLTDRDRQFSATRDLDGEEPGERSGDDERFEVGLFCDKEGEGARLIGGDAARTACEVEVA